MNGNVGGWRFDGGIWERKVGIECCASGVGDEKLDRYFKSTQVRSTSCYVQ